MPILVTLSMTMRSRRPRRRSVAIAILPGMVAVLAACAGGGGPAAAAPRRSAAVTSPPISQEDLRQRLFLIADDSMQGRFTGSEGHVEVTAYLASEMRRLGLRPAGEDGSYFQAIPFVMRHPVGHALSAAGHTFAPVRDFVAVHPGGRILRFDGARVIFGGTIEDTVARITREQAAGKFVILIYGNPRNTAGNIRTAAFDPRLQGAAAIATVNPDVAMAGWAAVASHPRPVYLGAEDSTAVVPAAMAITARVAEALLGRPADSLVPIGTMGGVVHGRVAFRTEPLTVRNVVAVLPGSDPARAGEYVALGAHSDHIPHLRAPVNHDSLRVFNAIAGVRMRELGRSFLRASERAAIRVNVDSLAAIRPARQDSINNGADDDGSGTVALLEIAEALAAADRRPARSVLFVWHAAEELGLIGSRYFTDHPTVDRGAIVAQINVDMIGRGGADDISGGGPRYLHIIGWRRLSSELGDVIERTNQRQPVPFTWDLQFDAPGHPEQLYCRSDHYNYARYGVPIAFFSTGLHRDYHQVTDEPPYIDYAKLAAVTRLIGDVAVAVANLDHRPAIDGPLPDPRAPCKQ